MRIVCWGLAGLFLMACLGCGQKQNASTANAGQTLVEARKGFQTKLARKESGGDPAPAPPANVFELVKYTSPVGKCDAYMTPDPKDGKKHPAIIWITGGDCNSIDEGCWKAANPKNDQSAAAYRKAGIMMMFPSLRGGNNNPGVKEGFLGEVDDVLAAAEFLAKQPHIDPARIYLGGHSTGGTLVLLVAECSNRFRAVFSFGPVDDPAGYPADFVPFNTRNEQECSVRAPVSWLHCVESRVFVIEGTEGNLESLQLMEKTSKNPKISFHEVLNKDHFEILAPINKLLAEKILADTGESCAISLKPAELNK
ncbi:MAG: alpha/beta hydrolase family protein [Fimbriiglobus sp.]